MTGIYLRVQRVERFENLEIEEMTDAEVERAMTGRAPEELTRWIVALVRSIREAQAGGTDDE